MTNIQNTRRETRDGALEGVLDTIVLRSFWDRETRCAQKTEDYRAGQMIAAVMTTPLNTACFFYDFLMSSPMFRRY